MSFQICIKTDKSLQQLAAEVRNLLSLPPFRQTSFSGDSYCQFEMMGMLILIHWADEEDRDPEVIGFPYCFDLQMMFADHELNTDDMEYSLQPYYAQLLCFQLGLDIAYLEKQRAEYGWKIRYRYCCKNPKWNETILFGEPGWEPAVIQMPPGPWRSVYPNSKGGYF